jgi:hypothetical protein
MLAPFSNHLDNDLLFLPQPLLLQNISKIFIRSGKFDPQVRTHTQRERQRERERKDNTVIEKLGILHSPRTFSINSTAAISSSSR